MKLRGIAAAMAAGVLACGGGHRFQYPTASSPLRLDRVVLYRNGVGYFERTGSVDGDVLTLKVRKDQVNDLLKSLTIVERDSGHAVSVSMPLDPQTWANAALATLRPGQGSLAQVLDSLRGSTVTLTTDDGVITGRVAMVEQLIDAPPPDKDDPTPKIDHRVSLLDGDELHVVRLSKVKAMRLEDGDLAMQFNRTLDASAGEGMYQQVSVSIRLAGASSHNLLVSYVVAAPMWKPTYRVVLAPDGKGKALLQAWAVVDNTSGEEWRDVKLALTSGAPIAFRYDLHTPREIQRPDLTDLGVQQQAQAMMGEATYTPPPPPPPVAMPSPATGAAPSPPKTRAPGRPSPGGGGGAGHAGAASKSADMGGYDDEYNGPVAEEQPAPSIDYESLQRSTMAQAKPATASGQTRFEIDSRVTVPEGTSTMVAIVNADVEGEETFLYRPGIGGGPGYEQNPYRVVRFKNTTPFVLEPGPIGIYSGGSFVGEGISEGIGAATSATVPFSVETAITVQTQSGFDSDEMHLVKMSRGVLEVEQFSRRTTTYLARSQTMDQGFTVLVRHQKAGGNFELANRPDGTEDLPDGYLIRLPIEKGKHEGTLKVVEQTPSRMQITIWDAPAIDLLEKLVVDAQLGEDTKKKLRPIIDKRRAVGKLMEQIESLTAQRTKLDQRSQELRQNLEAIAKNPKAGEQRAKWTKQLDDFTQQGNKLGAQLADLEAKLLDQRTELENAVEELDITMPAKAK